MAWIQITEALIANRLAAGEMTALKNAAKAVAQDADQILADGISSVVREVRGYVGSCENNVLGAGETIPQELESATLALLRRYLFTRLPAMKGLYDELRQDETRDALRLLGRVADCKYKIIPPVTEAEEQPAGGGVELVNSRDRIATRDKLGGL